MWYRYHFATGDFLFWGTGTGESGTGTTWLLVNFCFGGTGTGESGTGTTWLLVNFCFGVPILVCLVSVPPPLQLFPNTIALPKTSQQQLPSFAMIHIHSLDMNPYNTYAWNPKNLHKSKNTRTIKGIYSYIK